MFGNNGTQLTEQHIEAIKLLVSKGSDRKLTDQKIADKLGVSRQTLFNWRKLPEFNDELLRQSEQVNRSLLASARSEAERIITNPRTKEATRVKLIELIYKENGKLKDVQEVTTTVNQSEQADAILAEFRALSKSKTE